MILEMGYNGIGIRIGVEANSYTLLLHEEGVRAALGSWILLKGKEIPLEFLIRTS